jgi:hypothetical protein
VNECLDTLVEAVDWNKNDVESMGGTAIYKIKDDTNRVVLLSLSKSYNNRGPNFIDYSQMEFECIVEIKAKPK